MVFELFIYHLSLENASYFSAFEVFLHLSHYIQLNGANGPLSSRAVKTAKLACNVLSYGGKADNTTDSGLSLAATFAACKSGGTIIIPSGSYAMATWVTVNEGNAWVLQFDCIIYHTGTPNGTIIVW